MTNHEKYKQAFSALHAPEDFSLEVKNMENKKSHKNLKIAVIALAAVLLSAGAVAIGRVHFVKFDVDSDLTEYLEAPISAEEFIDTRVEEGLKAKVPAQLSGGFDYQPNIIMPLTGTDENGNEIEFCLYGGNYVRGDEKIHLTFCRDINAAVTNPDLIAITIGDVPAYVCDGPEYRPVDGSEEQEEFIFRSVTWFSDGVEYHLSTDAYVAYEPETTLADLIDMAAEIIGK